MNELLLIGTASFFIATMFYIVKLVSSTDEHKKTGLH